jgi:hypothetical protein
MNEAFPALLRDTVFLGHFIPRPLAKWTVGAVSFDLPPPRPRLL